jgi:hypothetical protein
VARLAFSERATKRLFFACSTLNPRLGEGESKRSARKVRWLHLA